MPIIRKTALTFAAALLAAPAQAASPPTALCETVAKAIPMHSGYDTGRVSESLLDTISSKYSKIHWNAPIDGDTAAAEVFATGDDEKPLNIYRFAPQILAAETVAGTMHCQSFSFRKKEGGQYKAMAGSPGSEGMCWDDYARIGTVSSVPAMVEENDQGDNHVVLSVTAWENGAWSTPCTIDARFLSALRFDTNYCKGDACEVLGQEALVLAGRYRNDPGFRVQAAAKNADEQKLLSLAGGKLNQLPTFDISTPNPYTDFENEVYVPVTVGGKKLLAVVGGGSFGWREYPGYLVAFWRVGAKGALEPVAGFNIGSYRSAATSIVVSAVSPTKK